MQEIIIQVMNQFGYFGVAFLIMIENIFHYWFCAWGIDTLLRRSSFKR